LFSDTAVTVAVAAVVVTVVLRQACQTLTTVAGVNFINILREQFSYEILAPKISTQNTAFVQNFGDKNVLSYKKRACKKLMKLTAGSTLIFRTRKTCSGP